MGLDVGRRDRVTRQRRDNLRHLRLQWGSTLVVEIERGPEGHRFDHRRDHASMGLDVGRRDRGDRLEEFSAEFSTASMGLDVGRRDRAADGDRRRRQADASMGLDVGRRDRADKLGSTIAQHAASMGLDVGRRDRGLVQLGANPYDEMLLQWGSTLVVEIEVPLDVIGDPDTLSFNGARRWSSRSRDEFGRQKYGTPLASMGLDVGRRDRAGNRAELAVSDFASMGLDVGRRDRDFAAAVEITEKEALQWGSALVVEIELDAIVVHSETGRLQWGSTLVVEIEGRWRTMARCGGIASMGLDVGRRDRDRSRPRHDHGARRASMGLDVGRRDRVVEKGHVYRVDRGFNGARRWSSRSRWTHGAPCAARECFNGARRWSSRSRAARSRAAREPRDRASMGLDVGRRDRADEVEIPAKLDTPLQWGSTLVVEIEA